MLRGKANTWYVKYYLLYVVGLIVVFSLRIFIEGYYQKYAVFGLTLCLFVLQCKAKPYYYAFHNLACHYNQLLILAFSGYLILRENLVQLVDEERDLRLVQATIIAILVNCAFALTRLIHILVLKCKE